jgi:hypothetical protein
LPLLGPKVSGMLCFYFHLIVGIFGFLPYFFNVKGFETIQARCGGTPL